MIPFSLSKIAQILHAEWIGKDRIIQTISTNSTQIFEQCLFVALRGKHFDGHCFVDQAIFMGAHALLVNRYFKLDIPQLIVKDTYLALAQLGAWIRRQVSCKVIAITGSNGKTSVKEMTAAILRNVGQVIETQENFNNQLGVSLTLLRLTYQDDFLVLELGANNFGEIAWMSNLIHPDIVLINNIFSAHLSGFGSLVGVAEAKGEIFSGLSVHGTCVLNADNHAWLLWKKLFFLNSVLSFSVSKRDGVDFFATNINYDWNCVRFVLHTPCGSSYVSLSMIGIHNVSNALAASALSFFAGATLQEIVLGLEKMDSLPGRLFPIVLSKGKLLLDDSYNANIGSILVSMNVLKTMYGYRVIVLGDILDLGDSIGIAYHQKIGKLIKMTSDIDKVLTLGYLSYFISYFSGRGEHFYNKNMLIDRVMCILNDYKVVTVLIKGSHNMLMDQLIITLQDQIT